MKSKFSIKTVIVFSMMLWIAVLGYAELVVYIDQPDYHITRNDEITLSVNIDGVATDMRGFQIDFMYDPEYLEISDIYAFDEGNFLSDVGRTQFMVSGEAGHYLVGNAITGITFWASGSGTLFSVTMKAIKATDDLGTDVLLSNVVLRTPTNEAIAVDRVDNSNVVIDAIKMFCRIKAFLHGAYITGGSMRYSLTSYLPLTSPYNSAEVINALPDVSPNYIVDWVQVQLRETYNGPIVQSQSCFLLENGTVVDSTGSPNISFEYLDVLDHYIILRHRNHLGVMTLVTHSLSTSENSLPLIDLSTSGVLYGGDANAAIEVESGTFALISGDASGEGRVTNVDKVLYWRTQNGQFGYNSSDFNLNGIVQNTDLVLFWRTNNAKFSRIP